MSFILESIKKAERERKLGQQAPSIAVDDRGVRAEDIENNKMKWVLSLLALFVTAMFVWSAAQYFAHKDRQYAEELAFSNVSSQEETGQGSISSEETVNKASSKPVGDVEKRDVLIVPVKDVHKSDLKSVKLINADEEAPRIKMGKVIEVNSPVAKKSNSKKVTHELKPSTASAIAPAFKNIQPKSETATLAGKQELADIYSDLSKLAKQESMVNESKFVETEVFEQNHIDDELVQIETASYDAANAKTVKKVTKPESISRLEVTSLVPKTAVNTGVPDFGELPYHIQEKIPEFNVSVHMFHADPDQRRIRINGSMYMEGKSLQQDLALVEITRYGAVFDYQGHLFRLNVR